MNIKRNLTLAAITLISLSGVLFPAHKASAAMFTDVTPKKIEKVSTDLSKTKGLLSTLASDLNEKKNNLSSLNEAIEENKGKYSEVKKTKAETEIEVNKLKAEVIRLKEEKEKVEKTKIEKAKAEQAAKEAAKEKAEKERAEKEKASKTVSFGADGLLNESATPKAQTVINYLLSIPGHANGKAAHASFDHLIDELSAPEAVYVIHRCEGPGFGQTGAGYAGVDSPLTHQKFVEQQVNNRFGGSIHNLLKAWGTYSYGGY